jgi:hypothetical protein
LAISDDRENDEDPKRRDFRVFAHGILLNSIEEARHYIKGGTPSEWVKKPKNVEINKTLINHMIDLIRNPRMWETEERRRQIGEEAERLKSFVGDLLDTLAGIEKD